MKTNYSCDVQNLTIDKPHTLITSVSGTHLPDLENTHVKHLGIHNQKTKFLPINIAEYFPNLLIIQVSKSELEYITQNDFLGLTQITQIIMKDNIIKELPCGVFDTNKRLQQIHFEDNSLNTIGKDIFKSLPLLSTAHFQKNECIDKNVDKIEDLPELLIEMAKKCTIDCKKSGSYPPLSLSYDSEYYKMIITVLGTTIYNGDTKILILETNLDEIQDEYFKLENANNDLIENLKDLEKKQIETVEAAKLTEKKLKQIISTKDQNIVKNKKDIKVLETKVKTVTAANNKLKKDLTNSKAENVKLNKKNNDLNQNIKELEMKHKQTVEDAKQSEEKLTKIIFSRNNKIVGLETNIQNVYTVLGAAETNWTIRCSSDDLNDCYTKNLSIAVETSDYTNLKSFYEYKSDSDFRIENSKMTNLSNSFFKHYPLMKYFFVTDSGLKALRNGNFIDAANLLQITITRNQIRKIEDSTFEGAKNVEIMSLAYNRIMSLSYKAFTDLKKLKELNLSYNQIELLNRDIFANLPSLEVLHMENNAISVLNGKLFRNNPRLSRVYFNSNKLKRIDLQIFQNLIYLVYMNLKDNICISKEYKLLKNTTIMAGEIQQTC
ncbi:unnamed protein product [Diamesa serratosioi]